MQTTISNNCLCCNKEINKTGDLLELFYSDDVICNECYKRLGYHKKAIKIDKYSVLGLYPYDDYCREMMIQYKEYYDEALFPIFVNRFKKSFESKYKGYILVPVPSSKDSLLKRGFNQVKKMFSTIDLEIVDLFYKDENYDQKNSGNRKDISKHIHLRRDVRDINNKKVLIIDDILTSGETMKTCISLLDGKCKKIEGLVVCYNKSWFNKNDTILHLVR